MDLAFENGRFRRNTSQADKDLDLSGHLVLPGLINAHDHLELNLFPRLGTRLYANSAEWATDIYHPGKSPVQEHSSVPKPVRLFWGAIRNLVCGAITVAHHNPYDAAVFENGFPVRVVKHYGWAHSLQFSADLKHRFEQTPGNLPFIVHAAEGVDAKACAEIAQLERLGLLQPRTVLVHANAAGPTEIALLLARQCSIVWCPTSNLTSYGRTLTQETLRSGVPIALGTDSAISAETDLLGEIRVARDSFGLSSEEVYRMVTTGAAAILRLSGGEGTIQEGGVADLIAVTDEGQTPAEAIFELRPRLIIVGGEVKLAARQFEDQSAWPVSIEHRGRSYIRANIPQLTSAAFAAAGDGLRLAGKRVTS